ncbi:MAG: acetyl-CoA carboxylase biotin carboxyl carrier protein [Planctomycetaceae bacterium]|nr:acetyl-CoA carboxylase biotin carboxyl carrier protein [Planctomycetaceae bacterium]
MATPPHHPAKKPSDTHDVFNVRRVRRLVELMREYRISEVDLQHGDMRIQLKGNETSAPMAFPTALQPTAAPVSMQVAPTPPIAPPPSAVSDDAGLVLIKSPMVGTFYASPNPNSPPFVKVGDSVGPETTVCILEAMKVFNEIQAECSGKVVAVLAKNGEPVEFGKPLFKIDPR